MAKIYNSSELPLKNFGNSDKYNAIPNGTVVDFTTAKNLVTLDWLQIRINTNLTKEKFKNDIFVKDSIKIHLTGGTSRFYKCIGNVYYGEDKVAVICFDSENELHKGTATVKIENYIFYDNIMSVCLQAIFSAILDAVEGTYRNITRLDVAVDGVNFDTFITDLRVEKKYEQIKVCNVKGIDSGAVDGLFGGFTVGSRTGSKYAVYYNKTEEIKKGENKKQYIADWHMANGLSGVVKRFEIRLKSQYFRELQNFSVADFVENISRCNAGSTQILIDIFNNAIKNFFEFVPATGVQKNRRTRLQMFNLQAVQNVFVRVKRNMLNGVRQAKIITKRFIKECIISPTNTVFDKIRTVSEYVESFNLQSWLREKSPAFLTEIERECFLKNIQPYYEQRPHNLLEYVNSNINNYV